METLHIYTRVSTIKQAEKFSLDAQQKAGIQKAEFLKMNYEIHNEGGKSASQEEISKRPVLSDLLEQCEKGIIRHLFVTELDRLSRSVIAQQYLNKILADNGVSLHTLSQTFDLRDTEHVFMSDLLSLLAKRENTLKTKRSVRGMEEAVRKGRYMGGVMLPYGYSKDENGFLIVDEKESKAYLTMVEFCLRNIGTKTIADKLNELNIPTRGRLHLKNGTYKVNKYTQEKTFIRNEEFIWKGGTVYDILSNPLYKGERRYKGQIIDAPPIVSKDKWNELQLSLKRRGKPKQNTFFFLLKGLLRCGKCGANMYGLTRISKKDHYYMCSSKRERSKNCGSKGINIDKLDYIVWSNIITKSSIYLEFINKELRETKTDQKVNLFEKDIKRLQTKLNEYKKRKITLITLCETGRIDIRTFDERVFKVETEIKSLQVQEQDLLKQKEEIIDYEPDFSWIPRFKNYLGHYNLLTPQQEQRKVLLEVVKNIEVIYNDKLKCHNISIEMRIPREEPKTIKIESFQGDEYPNLSLQLPGSGH